MLLGTAFGLLYLHVDLLKEFALDLTIAYTETSRAVEGTVETVDTGRDPLEVRPEDDGLRVKVIRGIAGSIDHRREGGRSRITVAVKTD